jgi:hypothetical protein
LTTVSTFFIVWSRRDDIENTFPSRYDILEKKLSLGKGRFDNHSYTLKVIWITNRNRSLILTDFQIDPESYTESANDGLFSLVSNGVALSVNLSLESSCPNICLLFIRVILSNLIPQLHHQLPHHYLSINNLKFLNVASDWY